MKHYTPQHKLLTLDLARSSLDNLDKSNRWVQLRFVLSPDYQEHGFKDSGSFDPGKDIIIMAGIKDISKIGLLVGNIVDTYSEDFSKTKLINYED